MNAFIQHKHKSSMKSWEQTPQDKLLVDNEDAARAFAKSLSKHLDHHVRLVVSENGNGSGIYYQPEML